MKRLSLITEFDEIYKGSDLQKIVNSNPLPIKYTVDGFECFFYNANLFGLFEMKIIKDGITPTDFINDYKNGFIEGLEYLKKEAKIKISSFDDSNKKDNLIKRLKIVLHEKEFEFGSKGLINLVFDRLPSSFTEKSIFAFGKWNGIIHSIENLCEITGLNENDLKITSDVGKEKDLELNVFCKTMPLTIPKEHFKVLTISKSKNGKPFLTTHEFDNFVNRAFYGNTDLPKQKFNQAPTGEKLAIQTLFREFYENYSFEYFDTGQTIDIFIKILTENFVGWDFDNVKANFKTKSKKRL